MKTIETKSPAWIELEGKLLPIELFDGVKIKPLKERKISIRKTSGYKIPTNHTNPVYKVASALQKLKPNKLGAEILIKKNIPVHSGLRSQASIAAIALMALNRIWEFGLSDDKLIHLAQNTDPETESILRELLGQTEESDSTFLLIRPKHISISLELKKNPLDIFPDLKLIMEVLNQLGGKNTQLCGKGPAIISVFESDEIANQLPDAIQKKADFIWTGKTCKIDLLANSV